MHRCCRWFQSLIFSAVALPYALPAQQAATPAPQPAYAPAAPQLLRALRRGGLVLYFRHGPTDWAQKDAPGAPATPCEQQRNLSALGRAQLDSAARAIRALRIPVGQVFASRYCRTRQTAEALFAQALPTDAVTGLAPRSGLEVLLGIPVAGGTNRILVSHQDMLRDYLGIRLDEGEAAVFRPQADGSYAFLGRIPLAAWYRWAFATP